MSAQVAGDRDDEASRWRPRDGATALEVRARAPARREAAGDFGSLKTFCKRLSRGQIVRAADSCIVRDYSQTPRRTFLACYASLSSSCQTVL